MEVCVSLIHPKKSLQLYVSLVGSFGKEWVTFFCSFPSILVPLQLLLRNGKVVRFKSSLHDNISA